jgi:hypothetical protein
LHGGLASPLPAETVDVSASECAVACGAESSKNFEGASESGKIVYFTSTQKLTDDAVDGTASGEAYAAHTGSGCAGTTQGEGGCDLYVYDFEAPGTECQQEHKCLKLVAGGEVLGVAGIAEDGQRVYYVKRNGEGLPDLYVYDLATGQSTLVAQLSFGNGDEAIWQKEFHRPVEVTGEDGRYLLFASATPNLTTDQQGTLTQLFEYDAVTGELVRVTKGEDGYNDNGNGVATGINPETIEEVSGRLGSATDFKLETNQLNISRDGRTVVFKALGLSPYAASAEQCFSVYEFHADGPLSSGEVHLLSDGRDTTPIQGVGCGTTLNPGGLMDATGENILFSTADSLVPTDTDGGQPDLYDARTDGGFALPRNALCSGEGCGPATPGGGDPRLRPRRQRHPARGSDLGRARDAPGSARGVQAQGQGSRRFVAGHKATEGAARVWEGQGEGAPQGL